MFKSTHTSRKDLEDGHQQTVDYDIPPLIKANQHNLHLSSNTRNQSQQQGGRAAAPLISVPMSTRIVDSASGSKVANSTGGAPRPSNRRHTMNVVTDDTDLRREEVDRNEDEDDSEGDDSFSPPSYASATNSFHKASFDIILGGGGGVGRRGPRRTTVAGNIDDNEGEGDHQALNFGNGPSEFDMLTNAGTSVSDSASTPSSSVSSSGSEADDEQLKRAELLRKRIADAVACVTSGGALLSDIAMGWQGGDIPRRILDSRGGGARPASQRDATRGRVATPLGGQSRRIGGGKGESASRTEKENADEDLLFGVQKAPKPTALSTIASPQQPTVFDDNLVAQLLLVPETSLVCEPYDPTSATSAESYFNAHLIEERRTRAVMSMAKEDHHRQHHATYFASAGDGATRRATAVSTKGGGEHSSFSLHRTTSSNSKSGVFGLSAHHMYEMNRMGSFAAASFASTFGGGGDGSGRGTDEGDADDHNASFGEDDDDGVTVVEDSFRDDGFSSGKRSIASLLPRQKHAKNMKRGGTQQRRRSTIANFLMDPSELSVMESISVAENDENGEGEEKREEGGGAHAISMSSLTSIASIGGRRKSTARRKKSAVVKVEDSAGGGGEDVHSKHFSIVSKPWKGFSASTNGLMASHSGGAMREESSVAFVVDDDVNDHRGGPNTQLSAEVNMTTSDAIYAVLFGANAPAPHHPHTSEKGRTSPTRSKRGPHAVAEPIQPLNQRNLAAHQMHQAKANMFNLTISTMQRKRIVEKLAEMSAPVVSIREDSHAEGLEPHAPMRIVLDEGGEWKLVEGERVLTEEEGGEGENAPVEKTFSRRLQMKKRDSATATTEITSPNGSQEASSASKAGVAQPMATSNATTAQSNHRVSNTSSTAGGATTVIVDSQQDPFELLLNQQEAFTTTKLNFPFSLKNRTERHVEAAPLPTETEISTEAYRTLELEQLASHSYSMIAMIRLIHERIEERQKRYEMLCEVDKYEKHWLIPKLITRLVVGATTGVGSGGHSRMAQRKMKEDDGADAQTNALDEGHTAAENNRSTNAAGPAHHALPPDPPTFLTKQGYEPPQDLFTVAASLRHTEKRLANTQARLALKKQLLASLQQELRAVRGEIVGQRAIVNAVVTGGDINAMMAKATVAGGDKGGEKEGANNTSKSLFTSTVPDAPSIAANGTSSSSKSSLHVTILEEEDSKSFEKTMKDKASAAAAPPKKASAVVVVEDEPNKLLDLCLLEGWSHVTTRARTMDAEDFDVGSHGNANSNKQPSAAAAPRLVLANASSPFNAYRTAALTSNATQMLPNGTLLKRIAVQSLLGPTSAASSSSSAQKEKKKDTREGKSAVKEEEDDYDDAFFQKSATLSTFDIAGSVGGFSTPARHQMTTNRLSHEDDGDDENLNHDNDDDHHDTNTSSTTQKRIVLLNPLQQNVTVDLNSPSQQQPQKQGLLLPNRILKGVGGLLTKGAGLLGIDRTRLRLAAGGSAANSGGALTPPPPSFTSNAYFNVRGGTENDDDHLRKTAATPSPFRSNKTKNNNGKKLHTANSKNDNDDIHHHQSASSSRKLLLVPKVDESADIRRRERLAKQHPHTTNAEMTSVSLRLPPISRAVNRLNPSLGTMRSAIELPPRFDTMPSSQLPPIVHTLAAVGGSTPLNQRRSYYDRREEEKKKDNSQQLTPLKVTTKEDKNGNGKAKGGVGTAHDLDSGPSSRATHHGAQHQARTDENRTVAAAEGGAEEQAVLDAQQRMRDVDVKLAVDLLAEAEEVKAFAQMLRKRDDERTINALAMAEVRARVRSIVERAHKRKEKRQRRATLNGGPSNDSSSTSDDESIRQFDSDFHRNSSAIRKSLRGVTTMDGSNQLNNSRNRQSSIDKQSQGSNADEVEDSSVVSSPTTTRLRVGIGFASISFSANPPNQQHQESASTASPHGRSLGRSVSFIAESGKRGENQNGPATGAVSFGSYLDLNNHSSSSIAEDMANISVREDGNEEGSKETGSNVSTSRRSRNPFFSSISTNPADGGDDEGEADAKQKRASAKIRRQRSSTAVDNHDPLSASTSSWSMSMRSLINAGPTRASSAASQVSAPASSPTTRARMRSVANTKGSITAAAAASSSSSSHIASNYLFTREGRHALSKQLFAEAVRVMTAAAEKKARDIAMEEELLDDYLLIKTVMQSSSSGRGGGGGGAADGGSTALQNGVDGRGRVSDASGLTATTATSDAAGVKGEEITSTLTFGDLGMAGRKHVLHAMAVKLKISPAIIANAAAAAEAENREEEEAEKQRKAQLKDIATRVGTPPSTGTHGALDSHHSDDTDDQPLLGVEPHPPPATSISSPATDAVRKRADLSSTLVYEITVALERKRRGENQTRFLRAKPFGVLAAEKEEAKLKRRLERMKRRRALMMSDAKKRILIPSSSDEEDVRGQGGEAGVSKAEARRRKETGPGGELDDGYYGRPSVDPAEALAVHKRIIGTVSGTMSRISARIALENDNHLADDFHRVMASNNTDASNDKPSEKGSTPPPPNANPSAASADISVSVDYKRPKAIERALRDAPTFYDRQEVLLKEMGINTDKLEKKLDRQHRRFEKLLREDMRNERRMDYEAQQRRRRARRLAEKARQDRLHEEEMEAIRRGKGRPLFGHGTNNTNTANRSNGHSGADGESDAKTTTTTPTRGQHVVGSGNFDNSAKQSPLHASHSHPISSSASQVHHVVSRHNAAAGEGKEDNDDDPLLHFTVTDRTLGAAIDGDTAPEAVCATTQHDGHSEDEGSSSAASSETLSSVSYDSSPVSSTTDDESDREF